MTDVAPALTERLDAVEARLAELERRLPSPTSIRPRFAEERPLPPEVLEWYKRIGADGPPIGIEALHQMQLDEGADPNSTWCREEIERMREE